jgi:hypothetical protein
MATAPSPLTSDQVNQFNYNNGLTSGGQNSSLDLSSILPFLGGAAGFFPTPSGGSGTSATQSNSTTGFSQSLQTLLNTLSQISGKTSQQGTSTGTTSGTTTGGYANQGDQNLSTKLSSAFSNLTTAPDLTGYQAQQTEGINKNSQLQGQAQQEALAARGLSTSPVAGAVAAGNESQRVGQISNLQASIPLLSNQLSLANLSAGNSYLANAPKTSATTGTQTGSTAQTGTSDQTQSTNQTGSQTGSGGSTTLANSNTQTTQQQKAGGGLGGLFGGLGSVLAGLFG